MTQFVAPCANSQDNPAEGMPCQGEGCCLTWKLTPSSHTSQWAQQRHNPRVGDGWCNLLVPGCKATICWTERPCCCFVSVLPWEKSLAALLIAVVVQPKYLTPGLPCHYIYIGLFFLSSNPNYWNGKDIILLAIIISMFWVFFFSPQLCCFLIKFSFKEIAGPLHCWIIVSS